MSEAPRPGLALGDLVANRYRVQGDIATGGMGHIYLAEQVPLGRHVALKVIDAGLARKYPEFKERFLVEAASGANINHPNIVTVYDYGRLADDADGYFIAMEYVKGESLLHVLTREGSLPWERAVRIAAEVARGLGAAHQHGVVHRDLKPANIMVVQDDDRESVKVLDFGIAKVMGGDLTSRWGAGEIIGSPRYMSPEQIRGDAVDGRTDMYGLGIVLYRMLTGRLPFSGSDTDCLLAQVQNLPPPFIPPLAATMPAGVEALVMRCLRKRPEDRWASAAELLEAVRVIFREQKVAPLSAFSS